MSLKSFLFAGLFVLTSASGVFASSPLDQYFEKILPYDWEGKTVFYDLHGDVFEETVSYYSVSKDANNNYKLKIDVDSTSSDTEEMVKASMEPPYMVLSAESQSKGMFLEDVEVTAESRRYTLHYPDKDFSIRVLVKETLGKTLIREDSVYINGVYYATRVMELQHSPADR